MGNSASQDQQQRKIAPGDLIRVHSSHDFVKTKQNIHDEYYSNMKTCIGKMGFVLGTTLTNVTAKHGLRLWSWKAECVTKITSREMEEMKAKHQGMHSFSEHDIVRIGSNEVHMKAALTARGMWNESVGTILGKYGYVTCITQFAIIVKVHEMAWPLVPMCVSLIASSRECNDEIPRNPSSANMFGLQSLALVNIMQQVQSVKKNRRIWAEAIQLNDMDQLRELLRMKAFEINHSINGLSVFEAACLKGGCEMVEFLIQQGANVSQPNSSGDLPIHLATIQGHSDVVRLLIQSGSPCNARNKKGISALHLAAFKGGRLEIVRLLIENMADLNIQDCHGDTPLHVAIRKGKIAEAKLLIHHNASLQVCNQRGFQILLWATYVNASEILKYILETRGIGDLINAAKDDGITALHLVAINDHKECCKVLCDIPNIQVNCRNKIEQTPLHLAVIQGSENVLSMLLQHKDLNIDAQDVAGDTPLMDAVRLACKHRCSGHEGIVGRVSGFGSMNKIVKNHRDIVRRLVFHGADVNKTNKAGKSPLSSCTGAELIHVLCRGAHASESRDPKQHQERNFAKLKFSDVGLASTWIGVDVKEAEDAIIQARIQMQCRMCCNRPFKVVFQCGHALCEECSWSVENCPTCDSVILQKIKMR